MEVDDVRGFIKGSIYLHSKGECVIVTDVTPRDCKFTTFPRYNIQTECNYSCQLHHSLMSGRAFAPVYESQRSQSQIPWKPDFSVSFYFRLLRQLL